MITRPAADPTPAPDVAAALRTVNTTATANVRAACLWSAAHAGNLSTLRALTVERLA